MIYMEVLTLELPAMYGDHHVIEVRRLLLDMPGVQEVYASSGFRVAEISFNPDKISAEDIKGKLDKAGYLGELPLPVETGVAAYQKGELAEPFFRHTEAFEKTSQVVGFSQTVSYEGRPLWPCPGMEPLRGMDED
jgi:copper chaperone CopZ